LTHAAVRPIGWLGASPLSVSSLPKGSSGRRSTCVTATGTRSAEGQAGILVGPGPRFVTSTTSRTTSRLDDDEVLDVGDARSRPGRTPGSLFFSPGAHAAVQGHLVTVHLDRDASGVQFGAALERILDLGLELGRGHPR